MKNEIELVKTTSNVGETNLHLQLKPAYRKNIFTNEQVRELTKVYFLEKAKKLGIIIATMDFRPDNFHAFISNGKDYNLEKLVNELKVFTSYMMRRFHWGLFRDKLWGRFWRKGYFYRAVGVVTADAVKYYVEHGQQKH